jgi:FtsH-binding integral membrane protein
MALVPMPSWLKFILFCLFSSLFGIALSVIKFDKKVIYNALFGTLSIFTFMFLAGLSLIFFGVFLSSTFGFILFLSLFALMITRIVFSFTQNGNQRFLYFVGLLLFSIYIVYDTNVILRRDYYGDFITASMDYYLDILNIFLNLVGIGSDN